MRCLVYCVLRDGEFPASCLPQGLNGDAVSLVGEGGLAAAFSPVPDSHAEPSLPRAMAFARVVEAFHQRCTALPLRYGCVVEGEPQVAALLRERRAQFLASLGEIEGCVEMSLRVLLPDAARPQPDAPANASAGRAYLTRRIAHYAAEERRELEAEAAAESIRSRFAGLHERSHAERGAKPLTHTVHFLVRRGRVEAFRAAFGRLQAESAAKVMLSGPWPPYNFAACEEPSDRVIGPQIIGSSPDCGAASIEAAQ